MMVRSQDWRSHGVAAAALSCVGLLLGGCSDAPSPRAAQPGGEVTGVDSGGTASGGANAGGGVIASGGASAGAGSGGSPSTAAMPPMEEVAEVPALEVSAATAIERLAGFLWPEESPEAAVSRVSEALGAAPSDAWSDAEAAHAAAWMLNEPDARSTVETFYRYWLGLDMFDDVVKQPEIDILDDELRSSMKREAPAFGVHETLEVPGTFGSLLLTPQVFVDARLAAHYGLSGVDGSAMQPAAAEGHRVGILAGAGLLTLFASTSLRSWPAKRTWLVLEPLLCFRVPTGVPLGEIPGPTGATSVQTQMTQATAVPNCMNCHVFLNSPGAALIGFDSFGRWDPLASFGPEETVGWIPELVLADAPAFSDWPDLMVQMAERDEARRCFVDMWLRYASGVREPLLRGATAAPETLGRLTATFARQEYALRGLVEAVAIEVVRGSTLIEEQGQ